MDSIFYMKRIISPTYFHFSVERCVIFDRCNHYSSLTSTAFLARSINCGQIGRYIVCVCVMRTRFWPGWHSPLFVIIFPVDQNAAQPSLKIIEKIYFRNASSYICEINIMGDKKSIASIIWKIHELDEISYMICYLYQNELYHKELLKTDQGQENQNSTINRRCRTN